MSGFSTAAILIKKIEYGDHDLILTFFTKSMGKVSAIAKNAKKSVKRFSGALDLFSLHQIHCTFPKKKTGALMILAGTDLEMAFEKIRTDITKTGYACYWMEMIHCWVEELKPQEDLFELLCFSLDALNTGIIDTKVLSLLFQIRFMRMCGFDPGITHCSACHTPLDSIEGQTVLFDFVNGRIVCRNCQSTPMKNSTSVSKGTLKQLLWINTADIRRADRMRFSAYALKEGEALMESFIPFHIGRDLKSLLFLNRIRRGI